ncbi:hypothetical protein [Blastococcus sp. TF02A-26]|uniref:hypothetical protein n=1 Tax=Blastococcus sp. TF02A-26 TaxID=2250577 RepID=UPI0011BDD724|nr:hypothetical protein [Blastococcus sp. TF02A-26]
MELAGLVLDYLKALAWPAVVLLLGFLFRRQISALLGDVEEFSALGASVRLAKRAEEAEKASLALPDRVQHESPDHYPAEEGVEVGDVAVPHLRPGGLRGTLVSADVVSVLRAWHELEESARRAAVLLGLELRSAARPLAVVEAMRRRDWVSPETVKLAQELTVARDELVHRTVDISNATAASLVDSIDQLTSIIRVAVNHHGGGEVDQAADGPSGGWTPELAHEMVSRLDARGNHVQIATLAYAAHHGGHAPRSVVYRLGQYPATRSLKGFTRPVNSIMDELVHSGLAPSVLENPMQPVYDVSKASFQQAQGFRMPADAAEAFAQVLPPPVVE